MLKALQARLGAAPAAPRRRAEGTQESSGAHGLGVQGTRVAKGNGTVVKQHYSERNRTSPSLLSWMDALFLGHVHGTGSQCPSTALCSKMSSVTVQSCSDVHNAIALLLHRLADSVALLELCRYAVLLNQSQCLSSVAWGRFSSHVPLPA